MAQTKDAARTTEIKKRAAKLRAVRAEELRETLAGHGIIARLSEIDKEYTEIVKTLKKYPRGIGEDKGRQIKLRLDALGKSADLNFKKLRKLLPDMQHVDLGTEDGDTLFDAFTKAVMHGIDKANAIPGETPVAGELDKPEKLN